MLAPSFFDDDPFYRGHMSQMNAIHSQMDMMMNGMMHPFAGFPGAMHPHLALTDGSDARSRHHAQAVQQQQQQPNNQCVRRAYQQHADPFNAMFGNMHSMMSGMMGGMPFPRMTMGMGASDPETGQFYSSSSVMSYSHSGDGPPRIYQASSSTRQAPGGVRETHRSMRDSESGVQRMAVGRHINERGHIMTREQNVRTGDREENEELINLDDEEKPTFNAEWQQRTRDLRPSGGGHSNSRHRAIDNVRERDEKYKPSMAEGPARRKKTPVNLEAPAHQAPLAPRQRKHREGQERRVRIDSQPRN